MTESEDQQIARVVSVTEIRALEWELTEIMRRLELVQQQLQQLQMPESNRKQEEEEPGSL